MFFSVSSLLCYRNAIDFHVFMWYAATLLNLIISFKCQLVGYFWSLLCKWSCHLQIGVTRLLPILLEFFLFLFLLWLLHIKFQVLCWREVMIVDTLVLLLLLEKNAFTFPHLVWCWQCICWYVFFVQFQISSSVPIFIKVPIVIGCWMFSKTFSASL